MERQVTIVDRVIDICHTEFKFEHFLDVIEYFKKVINLCKQMNYQPFESDKYFEYEKELKALLAERKTA